jgi:hypothetical protein
MFGSTPDFTLGAAPLERDDDVKPFRSRRLHPDGRRRGLEDSCNTMVTSTTAGYRSARGVEVEDQQVGRATARE